MTRRTPDAADPGQIGPTATGTATYEIRVAGHLDDHWAATLDDLVLVRLDDGTTSLTGFLDQAHLHGVLARIRDLGVPLLTLRPLDRVGTRARTASESPPGVVAPDGQASRSTAPADADAGSGAAQR